jgi:hypothetical protein
MTVRIRARTLCVVLALTVPARASCVDGVQNGRESDVDCGGSCVVCERGDRCYFPTDCYSGRCAEGVCEERVQPKGGPVPLGYRVEPSDTDGAAITRTIGWVGLGVGYGAAYVAALSLPGELSWLYAPVIGPWIKVADPHQNLRGVLAIDGLFQTVGGALVLGGVVASGDQLVRDQPRAMARVRVSPAIAPNSGGIFVYGVF